MDEKDQSNQHASGVWVGKSPTGFQLTSKRCAKMNHSNGKPWEVFVWNFIEHPQQPDDVVNSLSVPRFYEHRPRSVLTLPFLGKLKDGDLQNLEPHVRIYPTGFSRASSKARSCPASASSTAMRRTRQSRTTSGAASFITTRRPIPNGSSPRSARATTSS